MMNTFLKVIGALVVLAGIATAAYYFVSKFLFVEDECDDCDEISCFDEDEVAIDEADEAKEEKEAEEKEETEE